jgi:hypothetical protein
LDVIQSITFARRRNIADRIASVNQALPKKSQTLITSV